MVKTYLSVSAFVAACAVAQIAVAAPSNCVRDGAIVTASGVLRLHHAHDRGTGEPITYVMLETNSTYCISGHHVDVRSRTPTSTIGIVSEHPKKPQTSESETQDYLNRSVVVHGKLMATNMGGPQLFYDDIKSE